MKNKKAIYILLPIAVLIWSYFIYMIYNGLHPSNDFQLAQSYHDIKAYKDSYQLDTFTIVNNYRDPFLGKTLRESHHPKPQSPIINPKPKITTVWPLIVYSGVIKNQSSKKEVAMVQINGQSHLMQVKDIVLELQLLKIYKDSIQVEFSKEKKMVKKMM